MPLSYPLARVRRFPTPLLTIAWPGLSSILPSLVRILVILCSRFASSCTIRVPHTLPLSSTYCATFRALSILVFFFLFLQISLSLLIQMPIGGEVLIPTARHPAIVCFLGLFSCRGHQNDRHLLLAPVLRHNIEQLLMLQPRPFGSVSF